MAEGMYALANPSAATSINLNNEFNLLGRFSCLSGTNVITYGAIDDAPKEKEIEKPKKTSWWKAALCAAAAVAVVGVIAVAAVATGGAALGVAVLACAGTAAAVSGGMSIVDQLIENGEVDWANVVISMSAGAISGAVAATPLGRAGQMVVNAALGGAQAYMTGGDAASIVEGTFLGGLGGFLGGEGFKHGWPSPANVIDRQHVWSLFIPYRTFTKAGLKCIGKGVMYGAGISFGDTVVHKAIDGISSWLGKDSKSKTEPQEGPSPEMGSYKESTPTPKTSVSSSSKAKTSTDSSSKTKTSKKTEPQEGPSPDLAFN